MGEYISNWIFVVNILFWPLLGGAFFFGTAPSFFGTINPNPLGLLSSMSLLFFSLSGALFTSIYGRRILLIYIIITISILWIITISNWWYFQYFQSYYNYESLRLGVDLFDAFKAISAFEYRVESIYYFLAISVSACLAMVFYRKPLQAKKYYYVFSLLSFVVAAIMWCVVNSSLQYYKNLNISILKPSYLHPVQAFFTVDSADNATSAAEVKAHDFFSESNFSLASVGGVDFALNQRNVIYIVLESTRASLLGTYGSFDGLSPNLDALSKSLLVSKNFYANSNYTIKSEVASWCGIFDNNAKPPISKSADAIKNLRCLPKILAERGYQTSYFHGNTSSFNSRDEFLPIVGFQNLYFPEDEIGAERLPKIGWGLADEYMYQFMLDTLLQKSDKPFFAHFMTVSSHYPYGWDWGVPVPTEGHSNPKNASEVLENYKNAVFYEDYALGKFWQAFKQSTLYDNTIVVITADHGVWVFDEEDEKTLLQKNEEFFRIPLLIYHPDIKEPLELVDPASQIDLPETVLNMLGIKEYDDFFVGKNLFEKVENPWAIMMKQGDIVVRKNDTICYVEGAGCAGIQQDCVAIEYGELLPNIDKLQRCEKVTGNLLREGDAYVSPQSSDPDLMDKAFSLIRFHNKNVFKNSH